MKAILKKYIFISCICFSELVFGSPTIFDKSKYETMIDLSKVKMTDESVNSTIKEMARKKNYRSLVAKQKGKKLFYFGEEGKTIKTLELDMTNKSAIKSWADLKSKYINYVDQLELRSEFVTDVKKILEYYGYTIVDVDLEVTKSARGVSYVAHVYKGKQCIVSNIEKSFKNNSGINIDIKAGDICNLDKISGKIEKFVEKVKDKGFHKAIVNLSRIEYNDDRTEAAIYLSGYLGVHFKYQVVEAKKTGFLSTFLGFAYKDNPLDGIKNKYTTEQSVFYRIKNFYINRGYYDVVVNEPTKQKDSNGFLSIIYNVVPGPLYTIGHIKFIGNRAFTNGHLLQISDEQYRVAKNNTYNEQELDRYIELLYGFYFSKGYWDTTIQKVNFVDRLRNKINLTFRIKEGKKYILNKVLLEGNHSIDRQEFLLESFAQPKKPISPDNISLLEKEILSKYNSKAFLSSAISLDFVRYKNSPDKVEVVDILVNIDEGKKYKIESVIINGLETISPKFIKQFFDFAEGDLYLLDKVESSRKQLLNLGVFVTVNFSKRIIHDNSLDYIPVLVYVDLKESNKGDISFGPGYDFKSGLLYNMEFMYKNPFGKAHKFLFSGSVSEEKQQPLISIDNSYNKKSVRLGTFIGITHFNPVFFNKRISQQINLFDRRSSSSDEGASLWVNSKEFKLRFEYNMDFLFDGLRIFWHYNFLQSIEEGEAKDRIALLSIANTNYSVFGLGFSLDRRDDKALPQSGFYVELNFDFANTLFLGDYRYLKNKFLFSYYFKIYEHYVFAFHFVDESYRFVERVNYTDSDKFISRAQRFFINTADKVRGFKNDIGPYSQKLSKGGDKKAIGGTQKALGGTQSLVYKFEFRIYKIWSILGLTLFLDGGNTFFSKEESEDINRYYFDQFNLDQNNHYETRDFDIRPSLPGLVTNPVDFIFSQYHSLGLSLNVALPIGVLNASVSYPISEPRESTWSRIDSKPLNNIKLEFSLGTFF